MRSGARIVMRADVMAEEREMVGVNGAANKGEANLTADSPTADSPTADSPTADATIVRSVKSKLLPERSRPIRNM
jgi:hypothetical protein